LFISLIKLF